MSCQAGKGENSAWSSAILILGNVGLQKNGSDLEEQGQTRERLFSVATLFVAGWGNHAVDSVGFIVRASGKKQRRG